MSANSSRVPSVPMRSEQYCLSEGHMDTEATKWSEAIRWWMAVSCFNLLTGLMRGVFTAERASKAFWASIDAQIPELTARWILHGGEFIPGWHPWDRGPLQPLVLLAVDGRPVPSWIFGVLLQSTWVVGVWALLQALGVPIDRIRLSLVLTALTGWTWVNALYPWPKLLGGTLCMVALAAAVRGRPVVAGILLAAAQLAHARSGYWPLAAILRARQDCALAFRRYGHRDPRFRARPSSQ